MADKKRAYRLSFIKNYNKISIYILYKFLFVERNILSSKNNVSINMIITNTLHFVRYINLSNFILYFA